MPIENFIVYQKAFDFFIWQKSVVKHLAKVHKYSLGVQIENEALVLSRNIIVANMARTGKAKEIERCLVSVEILKILFRAGYELNREGGVNMKQYGTASEKFVELGNLCGGWLKKFQIT
jgi:hypothetical protein